MAEVPGSHPMEWRDGPFCISTDGARLDMAFIHGFITKSYWGKGRSYDVVWRSVEGSLAFGLYHGDDQIGFARVITDYATTAYLADVFVNAAYRGKGLGKWLIECALDHPAVRSIRKWTLATSDAQALYARYGFTPVPDPDSLMERVRANTET